MSIIGYYVSWVFSLTAILSVICWKLTRIAYYSASLTNISGYKNSYALILGLKQNSWHIQILQFWIVLMFFFEVYGILISIARYIWIKYLTLDLKGIDNICNWWHFFWVFFFFKVKYRFKDPKTLLNHGITN